MRYIKYPELKSLSKERMYFLDAREESEFKSGHIYKAISIPWHEISKQSVQKLDKKALVVVYCQTGGPKGIHAANMLHKLGFNKVYVLQYGFEGWLLEKKLKRKVN